MLKIREAIADDIPRIAELAQACHGQSLSADRLRRKFWENPDAEPVILLAEQDGRIAGQYALWPARLQLGRESVMGAQSLDTMTHPDFRGRGIFVQLANAAFAVAERRGIEVLYGFPNPQSYPGFVRRLNWDHTGNVDVLARPLRLSRDPRVPRLVGPLADLALRLWPSGSSDPTLVLDNQPPTAAELDRLLLPPASKEDDHCSVAASAVRWAWRFGDLSELSYRWLVARRGTEPVAVGVWALRADGSRALLSALSGQDPLALQTIVRGIATAAAADGAAALQATSGTPALTQLLRRCGFLARGVSPLIVRKTTTRTLGANVHDHAAWRLFGADLDTY